ncbi:hypothetical protein LMG28688_00441 [Paraburkholderia caffeinitolerans]|uniref:Uncharacterized protein n=1 Tax=Paraburkholderia caffeinitolerans TaxID=1723730 RepID=A0A6J5FD31_9BURK|nr:MULTISPECIES: hypothetical protein [Paraburkholderia]CAB3777807.1 hypothetical protein LMG28688_00441 [Paraburkholderia caffeinitolerans]
MKLTKKVCTLTVAALATVAAVSYSMDAPDQDRYAYGASPCRSADASGQPQDCAPLDRNRLTIAALHGM